MLFWFTKAIIKMKVNLKEHEFYIQLPECIYEAISTIAEEDDKIDKSLSAYLLNLILTNRYRKESNGEWVNLDSRILRNYDHRGFTSKYHLQILCENKILDVRNHIANIKGYKNSARQYRVNPEYAKKDDEQLAYVFYSKPLVIKTNKHRTQKKINADYKSPHLTKWLNSDLFSIDIKAAKHYIETTTFKNSIAKAKRKTALKNFYNNLPLYSREGKDDRLHNVFVQMPSDLLQFITYDGQKIYEIDIKSAQPLLSTVILDAVINSVQQTSAVEGMFRFKCIEKGLKRELKKLFIKTAYGSGYNSILIKHTSHSITIMLQESLETLDFTEIFQFQKLVREGDIYTYIGEKLFEEGIVRFREDSYWVKLFDKDLDYMVDLDFPTLRKCGKKVVLNSLYASPISKVKAVIKLRELFPSTFKILDSAKKHDKTALSDLLQRLEANIILDNCTKKLNNKYPNTLLITRHDSVSTTQDGLLKIYYELKIILDNLLPFKISMEIESWAKNQFI